MKTLSLLLTLFMSWTVYGEKSPSPSLAQGQKGQKVSKSTSKSAAESVVVQPKEIFRTKAVPEGNSFYLIQLSACKISMISDQEKSECQLQVALEEDKKISSSLKFGVKMIDFKPAASVDDKKSVQFSSGEEEAGTELKITPIKLSKDLQGVLIVQVFGFEHVHREHFLFAVVDKKLKKIWGGNEGAGGPIANSTDIFNIDDLTQGFYFQKASYYSDAELPDAWNIQFYKWDSDSKKLVEIKNEKERPAVWAAVAGAFATTEEAHEFKTKHATCLLDYQNLSASEYPKLEKDQQVIAYLSTDKNKVEKALSASKTCTPKIEINLKQAL